MSTAQIDTCCKRLRAVGAAVEAFQFREQIERAAELHAEATRLRREAWEMYRGLTGAKSKPKAKGDKA